MHQARREKVKNPGEEEEWRRRPNQYGEYHFFYSGEPAT
jgi:hypothetical protein